MAETNRWRWARPGGAIAAAGLAPLGAVALLRSEWLWDLGVDLSRIDGIVALSLALASAATLPLARPTWRRGLPPAAALAAPCAALLFLAARMLHSAIAGDPAPTPVVAAVDGPVRLAFLGDYRRGSAISRNIGEEIASLHQKQAYAAIFLAGDNIYDERPFEVAYEFAIAKPLAPALAAGIPMQAALGSHDIKDGYDAGELASPALGMNGQRYYEWKTADGRCSVFVLDSERFPDDPRQYRWLWRALRACSSKAKIVVSHGPPHASDIAHRADDDLRRMTDPLFAETGVALVVSGKNHVYERRRVETGNTAYVTAGSSGRVAHPRNRGGDALRDAFNCDVGLFLDVIVDGTVLSGQAVSDVGEIVDRFELGAR